MTIIVEPIIGVSLGFEYFEEEAALILSLVLVRVIILPK